MPRRKTDKPGKTGRPRNRIYRGQHPNPMAGEPGVFEGWWRIAGIAETSDADWVVYERGQLNDETWFDVRVIARKGAPTKASYWLNWHVKDARLRRSRDAWLLAENRPALHAAVTRTLATYFLIDDIV